MTTHLEWGPNEGRMTWDAAVKLAASKGDGWRLPTVAELVSQYDYDADKPKDAGWNGWYWSSSPYDCHHAWFVRFVNGYVNLAYRDYEGGVRCVREVADISTDRSDESRKRYAAELRALAYRIEKGK